MIIIYQGTAAVVGRAPTQKDAEFVAQVVYWARQFDKAGRPPSGSEA